MDISQIDGYQDIINEIMEHYGIKEHHRNKIDQLLRNALQEGKMMDVDIRLLLDGGDYLYENTDMEV